MVTAKLEALRESLADEDPTAVPVKPDNAIGRLSRVDAMQQQQMAVETRRQREALRSRLERALSLIESGDYGTCPRCEEDISTKRLEAMPDAIFCISCAEAIEKG